MISKIKKLFYFSLLFLVIPIIGSASEIEIVGYNTSIKVGKDRIANVKEEYGIYFINNMSSFNRIIDTSLSIIRPNGQVAINTVKVGNITTSGSSFNEKATDKTTIVSTSINGIKDEISTVNLNYSYNLGKDLYNKSDEFYYNIASNFDTVISDIAFEIVIPSDANIEDIDFILDGKYNLTDDDVTYEVVDNVITGYLNLMLEEKQIFSIRVVLPNNYFSGATDNFNYLSFLYLLIPIFGTVSIFIFWFKYGKGNKVKKKFAYYAPNNFDSAEIGYLYKGKSEEIDITSLLLYLANQGYLKIEESDDGYKLGKENSFKFIKLKDYDKRNAAQKILFEGIFKDRDEATLEDIEFTILDKLLDAKKVLDNKDNRIKLFNLYINKVKLTSMAFIILSLLVINIKPVKIFTGSYFLLPVIVGLIVLGLAILFIFDTKLIAKLLLGGSIVGGCVYIGIYSLIGQNKLMLIYILGTILITLMVFLYTKLPLRTKFGSQRLGEVYGFKLMLESMSQIKLKELLILNPNYFYDMIPYASVFGILDTWTNKGKDLIKSKPEWHISNEEFTLRKENVFFKNVLFTTTQILIKGVYSKEVAYLNIKEQKTKTNLNS